MWRDRRFLGVLVFAVCGAIWYFYRDKPANNSAGAQHDDAASAAQSASAPHATVNPKPATPGALQPQVANSAASTASADDADKHAVIAQIRQNVISDPKFAEELIRAEQQRDPDGPDADERDALLVSALFNQRRMDEAKIEARHYYRRHPGGKYTDYLIRETRVKPPPPPINP